jgi:hypothetical protein
MRQIAWNTTSRPFVYDDPRLEEDMDTSTIPTWRKDVRKTSELKMRSTAGASFSILGNKALDAINLGSINLSRLSYDHVQQSKPYYSILLFQISTEKTKSPHTLHLREVGKK